MRKFGIEVEFGGDIPRAINQINQAGLSNRTGQVGYLTHDTDGWVVKTDASVYNGGEMVGPPLDFDNPDQRAQVTTAIEALAASGATTNESAGIHVHIDASDLTPEQIANVARCFVKFEDVIYRVASSGWRNMRPEARRYAYPLTHERVSKIAKAKDLPTLARAWYGLRPGQDHSYSARDHGHGSRYCGLNLHSYFYRQTIEFRIFNSSLNPERVQAYIAMCVAIVEDARRGNRRSFNKRYALGGMKSGDTSDKAAYHRFLQVLRYSADLSLEDMGRLNKVWKDSVPQEYFSSPAY